MLALCTRCSFIMPRDAALPGCIAVTVRLQLTDGFKTGERAVSCAHLAEP